MHRNKHLTHEKKDCDAKQNRGRIVRVSGRVVPELLQDQDRVEDRAESVDLGGEVGNQENPIFELAAEKKTETTDDHYESWKINGIGLIT